MSNDTETVGRLFEYAIELEKSAESLYHQLANRFAHYPDVALFWTHYANEEKGHASYIERIREGVDIDRLSLQADASMLQKARACLDMFSQANRRTIDTLDDALMLATELENSETNTVFEFIIMNFSTDELAKSHRFLRVQLSAHIARLENDIPNPYKSRIARQNVFALK